MARMTARSISIIRIVESGGPSGPRPSQDFGSVDTCSQRAIES
jgi:hypothetical protein